MEETFLILVALTAFVVGLVGLMNAGTALRRQSELDARVKSLEAELSRLSTRQDGALQTAGLTDAAPGSEGAHATSWVDDASELTPEKEVLANAEVRVLGPEKSLASERATASDDVERALGLVWASRIGAGLLLLGVLFFFKVAVERNWLGPWWRVGLGLGVGVACIGLAAVFRKRALQRWVGAMVGVGMAIVLAAVWVAHALYGLVPGWVAFSALSVFAVAAGILAVAWKLESVLVTASALGFVNLAALSASFPGHTTFLVYGAVLSGAVLVPAMRHRWDLAAVSVPLGLLPAVVSRHFGPPDGLLGVFGGPLPLGGVEDVVGAVLLAAGIAALFVMAARRLQNHRGVAAVLCWAAVVLAIGMAGLLVHDPLVLSLVAAGLVIVVAVARRWLEDAGGRDTGALHTVGEGGPVGSVDALFLATATVVGAALVFALWGDLRVVRSVEVVPLIVFAAVSIGSAMRSRTSQVARARELGVVAVVCLLWTIAHEDWIRPGEAAIAAASITALLMMGAAWWDGRRADGAERDARAVVKTAVISALVLVVLVVVRMGLEVPWTTIALAGLGLIVAGLARSAPFVFVWLSTSVLTVAVLLFLAVDVNVPNAMRDDFLASQGTSGAYLPPPWVGVRGLPMLALAVVGLAMRMVARRRDGPPWYVHHHAVIRVVGHVFALVYLIEQIVITVQGAVFASWVGGGEFDEWQIRDWVARGDELVVVLTTAGLAGFGALVLAWGFIVKERLDRWVGLIAIALALGKLVTYDLTIMDSVARTVVLASFGVLLLASGFLYARFAPGVKSMLGVSDGEGDKPIQNGGAEVRRPNDEAN